MPILPDALYYLTLGFFFTHELDAVKRHEWRLMPLVRSLPEKMGEQVFIWLHVPIIALLLIAGDGKDANAVRIALSAFAAVHVGLHWVLRNHEANEFNNPSSWMLILGAGISGLAYLIVAGMA